MTMRFHNSIRTLAFATALLQLLTLPATCVLHVGCAHGQVCIGHATDDEPRSPDTASHCDCGHDHGPSMLAQAASASGSSASGSSAPAQDPQNSRPHQHDSHHHHDSDSCRICQSAFALVTATVLPVRLPAIECVAIVGTVRPVAPQTPAGVRWYGRGPPTA